MKPILFNTEMVQAVQEDRKTVTRRVVKPQPRGGICNPPKDPPGLEDLYGNDLHQPYQPGDILWVRETWAAWSPTYGMAPKLFYKADSDTPADIKWHPSIHMPKEAARLFLRVTGVQVERLFGVTDEDARNEGFQNRMELIEVIHRLYPEAGENPWVWVIEFERISKEVALGGGGDG